MFSIPIQNYSTTGKRDPTTEQRVVPRDSHTSFERTPFDMWLKPFESVMLRPFDWMMEAKPLGSMTNVFKADVIEQPDKFCLCADLPGIKKDNIDIEVEGDFLTIRAERLREMEDRTFQFHRTELEFGKVERSFRIPTTVDRTKLRACFDSGVLTLEMPKTATSKTTSVKVPICDENKMYNA